MSRDLIPKGKERRNEERSKENSAHSFFAERQKKSNESETTTQFNEADFIKALFELQRLAPKTTVLLQTKKQWPIPLRKIEYIHFRKYKTYEHEYELMFDEVDYQTLLYAMKKQCKEMGVL
ncbi:hypothetical protein [Listeria innocua]|uniref:hypothetical protein n=1 Tax=Listeria innocua TaxID=1642 RepID=UPI00162A012D|nr:hypothetical protein [Listeria innocua]